MDIKEHIEAGHYPTDDKGRALVPTEGGHTATIYATDHPDGGMVIAGNVRFAPGVRAYCTWRADGTRNFGDTDVPNLLQPPPRKVKMMATLRHRGGATFEIERWARTASGPIPDSIELTGEYEEPWS